MGIVRKGSLGAISGKVGNVVVSKWRGKDVAKKPVAKRKKKKNAKPPLEQNVRLGLVTHFLSPFSDYIKIGLEKKTRKNPAFQTAVEETLKNAVTGKHPDFKINYKAVIFSKGDLDMAWGTRFELIGTHKVRMVWEVPETSKIKLTGGEIAYCMVYSENQHRLLYMTGKTAYRADLEMNATFADVYHGHTLHAWIFFGSPNGKSVSNTRYAGSVVVPEKELPVPAEQQPLPA